MNTPDDVYRAGSSTQEFYDIDQSLDTEIGRFVSNGAIRSGNGAFTRLGGRDVGATVR